MSESTPFRVLFVCTGNICRSPTAEAVLRDLAERRGLSHRVVVDSAGTHAYHVGESADPRSARAAAGRGYDLSKHRARKVRHEDFLEQDLVVAMDRGHFEGLEAFVFPGATAKLVLFLEGVEAAGGRLDTPDPYYGGTSGFQDVLDLCEAGCRKILDDRFGPA